MRNLRMRKVAKNLIDIQIGKRTMKSLLKLFYETMRENNIKRGERIKNGIQIANPEWSMCKALFLNNLYHILEMEMLLNCPKDLDTYDKKEE